MRVAKREDIFPSIRIQRISMDNFKNINHGDVVFNCGRKFVEQGTEADILGIYGQNGSGKSSVIEAIGLLKLVMLGLPLPDYYSKCIRIGADYVGLEYTFDIQYPDNPEKNKTVIYRFKIEKQDKPDLGEERNMSDSQYSPSRLRIFDESISATGLFNGTHLKMQEIINSSGSGYAFGPVRKIAKYVGKQKEELSAKLTEWKKDAENNSTSFLFLKPVRCTFSNSGGKNDYTDLIWTLWTYAYNRLCVVDERTADDGHPMQVPFYFRGHVKQLNLLETERLKRSYFRMLQFFVENMNMVIPTLIPDMHLVVKELENEIPDCEEEYVFVQLYSQRGDVVIPLRDESWGVIKLIRILSVVIAAYNDRSFTAAVDELDAGIFEYLLGEILLGLETYGRGQFIFTSHNLRPLEVLKKENILFTTTNPDNRFIRLKGVGKTNNLRSLYLREILDNTQDEMIYDAEKRQRMVSAFMRAGDGFDEE